MRPHPQYGIDEALLARAREIGRDRWAVASGGDPALVDRIRRAAARAGCTPREYLWRDALSSDVGSPRDGAVYWGYQDPLDPTVESHYVALAWAERHNAGRPGSRFVTFWTTAGAQRLDAVNGLNEDQRAELGLEPTFPMRMWECMCLRYSEETAGDAIVFAADFHPDVILGRTELPALRRNPLVGPDRVRFVYPPPERLSDGRVVPEPVREVVAEPGNQAGVQFYRPDRPGFLDIEAATGMSPSLLRRYVSRLRHQVAESDRRWRPLPITPDCPAGCAWIPPQVELRRLMEDA